jgi:hypothetical protein
MVVALADGSVRNFSRSMSLVNFQGVCRPDDGQTLTED